MKETESKTRAPKKAAPAKKAKTPKGGTLRAEIQKPEDPFVTCALEGVLQVAKQHEEFTTDDVWAWLYLYTPGLDFPRVSVMTEVMRLAAEEGLCAATKRTRPKSNSNRASKIWISLVRKPEGPVQ